MVPENTCVRRTATPHHPRSPCIDRLQRKNILFPTLLILILVAVKKVSTKFKQRLNITTSICAYGSLLPLHRARRLRRRTLRRRIACVAPFQTFQDLLPVRYRGSNRGCETRCARDQIPECVCPRVVEEVRDSNSCGHRTMESKFAYPLGKFLQRCVRLSLLFFKHCSQIRSCDSSKQPVLGTRQTKSATISGGGVHHGR